MNNNKSVIEWLQEEYHKRGESLPSGVFQEAKEMHRKEIIDAWNSAGGGDAHTIGEQYYYSTFDVSKLGNEDVPKLGDDVKGGELATFKNDDVREEILCAAVWYKDIPIKKDILDNVRPINCDKGLVFCGYRHCHCMYTMVSVTGLRSVETEVGEYVQGFLTNKNRFVDRVEGGIIHRANGNTTDFDDLYSEDLYTMSQVPTQSNDVREDDVEKLEENYWKELENRREVAKNFKGQVAGRHPDMFGHHEMMHMLRGYLEGYNKAKENTYTEEQVREAINLATTSKYDYKLHFYNADEIIQSLKQPKQ